MDKKNQIKDLEETVDRENVGKIVPFGAQYLEDPQVDKPGKVKDWYWKPKVDVDIKEEASSWPGTTGTGPTANEDERYSENQ